MRLSNLDVFLTWDDLKALLRNSKQDVFLIHDIKSSGVDVIVTGEASVVGCTANWSACFEPMRSDDGRCLVFHVKSFGLKEGFARFGFKFFKNFCKFDWSHNSEEFLVETCAKSIKGAWADGKHLLIDFATLLSAVVKMDNAQVQVGKITRFRSTGDGLHFAIERS